MCTVLWQEKHAGDPCRRGNCPSLFACNLSTCGTGCIYHAAEDVIIIHFRSGTDRDRIFLHTDHGDHLSLLGSDRNLPCDPSKHRPRDDQYDIEYAGIWTKHSVECRFYFWTVWSTEAWSDRCGDRNGIFQADTARCLRDRIFVEQRCKTESSLYVYPKQDAAE